MFEIARPIAFVIVRQGEVSQGSIQRELIELTQEIIRHLEEYLS